MEKREEAKKAHNDDQDRGKESFDHAGQDFAHHDGGGVDGGLDEDLEGLEIEPVQVDVAGHPGVGVIHGAHGHQAGDQVAEIVGSADLDPVSQAQAEGDQIDDRHDHGRKEIAQPEEPAAEEEHLPQEDGVPFHGHSMRSPVSLMKTSSRFVFRMVTPFSLCLASSWASSGFLQICCDELSLRG